LVEQGLTFTVIEAPHPLEDGSPGAIEAYDARKDFYAARRIWLGWTAGTDWRHDAIEREFGEDHVWYDVKSRRDATHVGAAGETAAVLLILMGVAAVEFARKLGGRLGELGAEDIYEWAKQLATRRREEKDLSWTEGDAEPDFSMWTFEDLPERLKGELADVMGVPVDQLEVVDTEQRQELVAFVHYRDRESGRQYTAELGRSEVVFKRIGASPPHS
jgi:hypothetical protein